jgi:hypothetical protein
MIRNLKLLFLAAMALSALSAFGTSAATAHTPAQFHSTLNSTTITSTTDTVEGSATAHHVFDVPGGGTVTCREINAHGTAAASTVTTQTVTAAFPVKDTAGKQNCTFAGQGVTVDMGNCDYTFHSAGFISISNHAPNLCALATAPIQITTPGCTVSIGAQGPLAGITYHNLNFKHEEVAAASGQLITLSANVEGIHGEEVGAGCPAPGTFTTGKFTTGNTILTGANPAKPTEMVPIRWSPTVA